VETKAASREGRQEERSEKTSEMQETVSSVSVAAKQETDIRARWAWVEASIWTDRMLAALEDGVTGGKWFSLMDKVYAPTTLLSAWRQVARNKGSHGMDGMSIARFSGRERQYLEELCWALKRGEYQPEAVKRVYIRKHGGERRPLGIPTVKDRVVQTALKKAIEPIFEREFAPSSYGFRPGRGTKDALREVEALLKSGQVWVVDADLKSYFDTIPHDKLMALVESRISDGKVLKLIGGYLKQDILEELKTWKPTAGTPQGAVLSPLFANLYLHSLDVEMRAAGYAMVRYADDFVVLCEAEVEAVNALNRVQEWVKANGLSLHPEKTHVGNCSVEGQGFDFLGYRFEGGKRYVRKKSLAALKDKLRVRTKRTRGDSINRIIEELNPILKGWFNYFKHAHPPVFAALDSFLRRRLRSILCKQNKLSYFHHRSKDIHQRWKNAYFAELGLFTLKAAWAQARQSR